jgi:uncharacterized protein (UPF0333 family)
LYSDAWKKESRAVYDAAANAAAYASNAAANASNAAANAAADTADTANATAHAAGAGGEREEIYKRFSDKLIELMRECK